jgi:cyclomaltodextrinase / maltogenic alpha-amylase / neopullulanase
MIITPSVEAARHLRPNRPFHLPPPAQPLCSWVDLSLENVAHQPDLVIRDIRRDIKWRITMVQNISGVWTARIMVPSEPTILRYLFELPDGTEITELRQHEGRNTPIYGEWVQREFQITVYDPAQMPAEWTRGMIIYQIFPDRFANGNTSTDRVSKGVYGQEPLYLNWTDAPEHPPKGRDFYGGDLRGIIERLDYLSDLDIDCIYLTPIFESPSNHRYDALDYFKIDPMLGTEPELIELIEKAHSRNIKVVLDAVFNHCSSDSRYFNGAGHYGSDTGATQNRESPYYRWFEFKTWPKEYDGWLGLNHMPEFVECPEVEDFFIGPQGVSTYWLQRGIDGWRTDVTRWVTDEFWRRFRKSVRIINPTAFLAAEEWENASHYQYGDTFDATMNYRFAWAVQGFLAADKISASELDDRLETLRRDTPGPALLSQMNLIDSHDTARAIGFCGGDKQRFMQMVSFQLAYPGAPMIYYGDEVGLDGDYAEGGRKPFPWNNIDANTLSFYRHAIAIRRQTKALQLGDVESVLIDDEHRIYIFTRRYQDQCVYIAFNASDTATTAQVPVRAGKSGQWHDALNTHGVAEVRNGNLTIELQPRGTAWYSC